MPRGFFAGSRIAAPPPVAVIPQCGACGLYKDCRSPKMRVAGDGAKKILLVGEAPGEDEDRLGLPLAGKQGQLIRQTFMEFGVDLDDDCWKTNAIICRPPGSRPPTNNEIDYCLPNLRQTIKHLNPEIIIPLGGPAVRAVVGPLWKEDTGPISRWVGWRIPCHALNAWICPVWHPSYVLREEDNPVVKILFRDNVAAALRLCGQGRPWPAGTPDWASEVRCTTDPRQAADWCRRVAGAGGWAAFDYETNTRKPDSAESFIASASIAWGKGERPERVFAFPWVGEAVDAFGEFLRSPIPKIAQNMKFEDRWSRAVFGHRVRNWVWDTMQAAHVLDCRPLITGLKFQAFVRLGMPAFNDHIEPFLKSTPNSKTNRVLKEIDTKDLLLYNGLDSLLEYRLAFMQMKDLQYPLPQET